MFSTSILTHLCAAEVLPGDMAHLVIWDDGQYGIARNGQPVGEEKWTRDRLTDCAEAFLHYVKLLQQGGNAAVSNAPAA